jgi:hypothetical protein
MKRRAQIYILATLLVLLAVVAFYTLRGPDNKATSGGATDSKFTPLDVREPQLRIDLLQKLSELEYTGTHRNIFLNTPPPPPTPVAAEAPPKFVGPQLPPPPPPLQVPAEYFGYSMQPRANRRVAFMTSGEDVLIVPEGDTFLNRFRLVRVGNESLDVEEISTGRHATLNIAPDQGQGGNNGS